MKKILLTTLSIVFFILFTFFIYIFLFFQYHLRWYINAKGAKSHPRIHIERLNIKFKDSTIVTKNVTLEGFKNKVRVESVEIIYNLSFLKRGIFFIDKMNVRDIHFEGIDQFKEAVEKRTNVLPTSKGFKKKIKDFNDDVYLVEKKWLNKLKRISRRNKSAKTLIETFTSKKTDYIAFLKSMAQLRKDIKLKRFHVKPLLNEFSRDKTRLEFKMNQISKIAKKEVKEIRKLFEQKSTFHKNIKKFLSVFFGPIRIQRLRVISSTPSGYVYGSVFYDFQNRYKFYLKGNISQLNHFSFYKSSFFQVAFEQSNVGFTLSGQIKETESKGFLEFKLKPKRVKVTNLQDSKLEKRVLQAIRGYETSDIRINLQGPLEKLKLKTHSYPLNAIQGIVRRHTLFTVRSIEPFKGFYHHKRKAKNMFHYYKRARTLLGSSS